MGFFSKNTADATIRVNYKGDNAKKGLNALKKTIGTVITVAVVKQLVSYSHELAKLGAQAELVNKNFENMAKKQGRSVDTMMAKMKKATLGMVDDMTLQQNAMKAMISGVDFDDMIVAMEYVTKYAAATGADVNQKMTTVMTGFARKSAMFMDDVGIQVMGAEDVIAATVDQMKEKMGEFATSEEDAAIKAEQLSAELKNQKVLIGKELIPILDSWNDVMAKKIVPTMGFLIKENVKMMRVLFTSETIADVRIQNMIEQAELLKDDTMLRKELNKVLEKEKSVRSELAKIQAKEEDPFDIGRIGRVARLNQEMKELNKQSEALFSAIGKQPKGDGGTKTTKDDDSGEKDKKKTKAKVKRQTDALIEGYREGLEERDKIQKEENEKFLQNEEDLINMRLDVVGEINTAVLGEERVSYNERIEELTNYLNLGIVTEEEYLLLRGEANDKFRTSELEKERALQQEKISLFKSGLNTATSITSALMQLSDARTNREIENLENQNLSEKDFQKKKEQILQDAEEKRRVYARVQQGIAIAEATVNAIKMGTGAGADTPGGAITRGLAMAAAIAAGMIEVATIEAQNFQTGRIGKRQTSRQSDDILAMVGQGETIIPAPQSAQHEDTLRAIANNTANTAAGIGSTGGGVVTNQFYGVSTEQVLQVISQSNRRHNVGVKL